MPRLTWLDADPGCGHTMTRGGCSAFPLRVDCRVRFAACGDFGGLIAPGVGFAGTPLVVVAGCDSVLPFETEFGDQQSVRSEGADQGRARMNRRRDDRRARGPRRAARPPTPASPGRFAEIRAE